MRLCALPLKVVFQATDSISNAHLMPHTLVFFLKIVSLFFTGIRKTNLTSQILREKQRNTPSCPTKIDILTFDFHYSTTLTFPAEAVPVSVRVQGPFYFFF